MDLKGGNFTSTEEIQRVVTIKLNSISKEEFFKGVKKVERLYQHVYYFQRKPFQINYILKKRL